MNVSGDNGRQAVARGASGMVSPTREQQPSSAKSVAGPKATTYLTDLEQQHLSNWWLCLTEPSAVTLGLQLISWSRKWDYPYGSAVFSEKPESISLTPRELYIKLAVVWQSPELTPIWHLANLLNTLAKRPCIVSGKRLTCCWNSTRTFRFVSFIKIHWKQMNFSCFVYFQCLDKLLSCCEQVQCDWSGSRWAPMPMLLKPHCHWVVMLFGNILHWLERT